MMKFARIPLLLPLLLATPSVGISAQSSRPSKPKKPSISKAQEAPAPEAGRMPRVIRFPEHRGLVLAKLDGQEIRLIDLGTHMKTHFDPGILERWKRPEGTRELNSPMLGQLLYQYLDVLALRSEAAAKKLPLSELPEGIDAVLREDFEKNYRPRYKEVWKRDIEKASLAFHKRAHRQKSGLRSEVKALLNGLVPGKYKVSEIRAFHRAHGQFFGGKIRIAHIFFETRDRATGRLLPSDRLAKIRNRIRQVRATLDKDPSEFQKLAARFSNDKVTGKKGGLIGWVTRFDKRLPAAIVRAAWSIDNGAITAPVESYYGYHIVCRVKFVQNHFLLPRGETYKQLAESMQQVQQEDFLFACRKRHVRELYL